MSGGIISLSARARNLARNLLKARERKFLSPGIIMRGLSEAVDYSNIIDVDVYCASDK